MYLQATALQWRLRVLGKSALRQPYLCTLARIACA